MSRINNSHKTLYFLTGPTGVGKTALAINWAREHGAEILSCDSLLFYQGMDIGTAKPTQEEMGGVVHHGIDVVPVSQPFNIKDYVELARGVIDSVVARGKKVLVVGGSGFYLKSFFAPVVDDIEVSEEIQKKIEEMFHNRGLGGVLEELMKLNPGGVGDLDIRNPRRVIKALGRCRASERGLLELKREFESQEVPFTDYEKKVFILECDPEILRERIRQRVFRMMDRGLIEEVKALKDKGIEKNPSAAGAIGYREVLSWLQENREGVNVRGGGGEFAKLGEGIILNTHQLIAKQRKWFRTQVRGEVIHWGEGIHSDLILEK